MLLRWLLGVQLSIPTTEQEAPKRRGRGSSTAVCGAGAGPHDGEAVSEADSEATDDGEGVEEHKDGEKAQRPLREGGERVIVAQHTSQADDGA